MPHFAVCLTCAALFAAAAFTAALLLCPARASVTATVDSLRNIGVSIALRLAFVKVRLELEMNILDQPAMTLFLKGKRAKKTLWSPGRRTRAIGKIDLPTQTILRKLDIRKIEITGELGVKDDAFLTAVLTGLLMNALLVPLSCFAFHNYISGPPHVYIHPAFNKNKFLLNFTGIASFIPIHIISAIVVWKLKTKTTPIGRKESLWHIQ